MLVTMDYLKRSMSSLYDYLKECQDRLGVITIDQAFIDYRNQMAWKFRAGNRDVNTRIMNADCLIVEYSLIQGAMVAEPYGMEQDFVVSKYMALVDAKIYDKWFNIPADKVQWYMKNIKEGLLTHFAFYRWVNKPARPLEVGDTVELRLIEVSPAETVLRNVNISQYDGYYYIPKNIVQ